jgi:hypothetical protein
MHGAGASNFYTQEVLPDDLKTGDIVDYVVRELDWVLKQLTDDRSSSHKGGRCA